MPPSGTAPPQGGPQSGGPPAAPPAPPPPATFPPTSAVQPPPIQKEAPKKTRVIVDRPDIELLAPENVIFDPNCDWTDPAQNSQYVRIARPMSADEAWLFCTKAQGPGKKIPFFNIPLETFKTRAAPQTGPSDSIATRVARQDGKDPIMMTSGAFGRVWLYEWFMKIAGTDYTFWSIATDVMISRPVPVADAYPEQGGARPITIGYGSIEAFRPYPTSPVESWAPIQAELNDSVNLRLDHLKQIVAPPAVVKRGADVDLKAVQKRGADRIIMVTNADDVTWPQIPDIPASAAQQDAQLNSDFDSLAGVMNMGSVQTNRQLNETVGGMNLLSGDANSMAEFDLSVWSETWVEPTIAQILKCIEYYESDETILATAGEKAGLFERFGISDITDTMLMAESSISLKVGVGSANLPMQKLQKFQAAAATVMQILQPAIAAGVCKAPVPNVPEIVNTVFGAAGFHDGGDRFFINIGGSEGEAPPDPAAQAAAQEADVKRANIAMQEKKIAVDAQVKQAQIQQKDRDNAVKVQIEKMRAEAETRKNIMTLAHGRGTQAEEHAHARGLQAEDHAHQKQQGQQSMMMKMFQGSPGVQGQGGQGQPNPGAPPQSAQAQPQGLAA